MGLIFGDAISKLRSFKGDRAINKCCVIEIGIIKKKG